MLLLGIDPLMDFEITWVVEEYRAMLQQPLPAGWKIVKHMSGTLHYVHLAHGVDSTEHPALKRFQKLVQYLKWAKASDARGASRRASRDVPCDTCCAGPRVSARPRIAFLCFSYCCRTSSSR